MRYFLSAFADEASSDLQEQIRICNDVGVKWIELRGVNGKNVSELTAAEAREIKSRLDEGGISVSSIGSPFGKIGVNDDFAPHLELFKRTVESAHIFDAKLMRLFSFYIPEGESPDSCEAEVMKRMACLLDNADGILLCHENEKGIYGENERYCKRLYDNFGGKLRLIFDPANFLHCGVDILPAYELLHSGIEYFHIKDCITAQQLTVAAGKGDGRIQWLIDSFANKGKDAFLSVEPHLKVFTGFDKLEKDGKLDDNTYASNEEAFIAAVTALQSVLSSAGFDQAGERGVWVR